MTGARTFVQQHVVRFGDCDPAGIVFYPRYFEWVNATVEAWWASIGLAWHTELAARHLVVPLSHVESRFFRPSRMGDAVSVNLRVESFKRSSVRLEVTVLGPDGDVRVVCRQRNVCTSDDDYQPLPWPGDMATIIQSWIGSQ